MKKRYIFLLFILGIWVFFVFRFQEYHDVYFNKQSNETVFEMYRDYSIKERDSRVFLLRKISEAEPYSLIVHIVLDDPKVFKSLLVKTADENFFDVTAWQLNNMPNNVIFQDMTRKYTLSYSTRDDHEGGYFSLYFNRIYFTGDMPLTFKLIYLNDDGEDVIDEVETVIKLRQEWSMFFLPTV
ncbi:MAG: hypothetical protein JKY84_06020 [Emcibacteraceae bacterium]|nr:hypothetical protein [Emcibacteraceae bacterium]